MTMLTISNTVLAENTDTSMYRMTTEEMEKYNQVYQEFYKDMYD